MVATTWSQLRTSPPRPRPKRRSLGYLIADHLDVPVSYLLANIPWDAPYYERCGFRTLPADNFTPGLLSIRREEADHRLDARPRVCMRRLLAEPNILDQP